MPCSRVHPRLGAELNSSPGHGTPPFNEPVEASLGAVRLNTSGDQVQTDDPSVRVKTRTRCQPARGPARRALHRATYHVIRLIPTWFGRHHFHDRQTRQGRIRLTPDDFSELPGRKRGGQGHRGCLSGPTAGSATWLLFLRSVPWPDKLLIWGSCQTHRELTAGSSSVASAIGSWLWTGWPVGLMATDHLPGSDRGWHQFRRAFCLGIPGEVIPPDSARYLIRRRPAGSDRLPWPAGRWHLPGPLTILSPAWPAWCLLPRRPSPVTPRPGTRPGCWVPSDIIHAVAMAIWTGGLVAMLLALLLAATASCPSRLTKRTPDPGDPEFFRGSSGGRIDDPGRVVQAIEVGSRFPDLVETQFGRAVSIKIVLFRNP